MKMLSECNCTSEFVKEWRLGCFCHACGVELEVSHEDIGLLWVWRLFRKFYIWCPCCEERNWIYVGDIPAQVQQEIRGRPTFI